MFSTIAIQVESLSKCYRIYDYPINRLKQYIFPRIRYIFGFQVKNYFHEFWAVKNISFIIKKGETVGLIGKNGSGKSTLLQMICGTLEPSTGAVYTTGRIIALLELGSGFNPEFTGRENVYINASIYGLSTTEINNRYNEIVAFAGIGDFIDRPVKLYSSGMMMRLAFSVSICLNPDILIIDEALAVGDAAFQFKCLDRLAVLSSQGVSILFVSHDMNMIKRFCHHVIYISKDQTFFSGASEEMAELYLLETRREQQLGVTNKKNSMSLKTHLSDVGGTAYGTDEGAIVSVCFKDTESPKSSYMYGERIGIQVKVRISRLVTHPNVSFTIQDTKLIVIGGQNFPLVFKSAENDCKDASVTASFTSILSAGNYFVTIKFMDGFTEETSSLIEKQVAVLSFEMLPSNKPFLGTIDLGFEESFSLESYNE